MITTVSFDAVGTLFRTRDTVGAHYAAVARGFGGRLDPLLADASFRSAWRAAPTSVHRDGLEPEVAEREWWRGIVTSTLDQLPSDQTGELDRSAYFEALFDGYADPEAWQLYPETIAVIEELKRRGLILGVISNFDSRLVPLLSGLGIAGHFAFVVHSGAAGARKPSLPIFTRALDAAGQLPGQCMHVGDDPEADWQGARGAGMRAFELDRTTCDLRELLGSPYLRSE